MKIAISLVAAAATASTIAACAPTMESNPVAAAVPATASLCRAGEQVLFQCQAGARTIALCGGGAGAERYVQYRYGMPGAAEITYPARGMAGLSRANIPFSGGGETQVNFTNAGVRYSVFSSTVRTGFGDGPNMPQFSAGVVVRQNGRAPVQIGCTAPADATFDAAIYDFLPEGEPVLTD